MSDNDFLQDLTGALHLACFICYLKEMPAHVCLADTGVIHELVHLLTDHQGSVNSLREVRNRFEIILKLA